MKDYIQHENDQALQTINTYVAKNPGFWRRRFPNEVEKEVSRIDLDRLRTIYEKKKMFFKLYTDVQLEIARRRGEALLVTVGADLAAKVSAFATEKMEELGKTLGESRERYMARLAPQYDNLDKYQKYPEMQARAHKSIDNEMNSFFEAVDSMLASFNRAMNSRIEPMVNKK